MDWLCCGTGNPVNTKYLYNICTTSAQRLRRWPSIVQMLYKCFVLTSNVGPCLTLVGCGAFVCSCCFLNVLQPVLDAWHWITVLQWSWQITTSHLNKVESKLGRSLRHWLKLLPNIGSASCVCWEMLPGTTWWCLWNSHAMLIIPAS